MREGLLERVREKPRRGERERETKERREREREREHHKGNRKRRAKRATEQCETTDKQRHGSKIRLVLCIRRTGKRKVNRVILVPLRKKR